MIPDPLIVPPVHVVMPAHGQGRRAAEVAARLVQRCGAGGGVEHDGRAVLDVGGAAEGIAAPRVKDRRRSRDGGAEGHRAVAGQAGP